MSENKQYDADVYAWSEHQAAVLRGLAARRDLPNDLDLAHIAEEIEDVGVSQLHAVRSLIRLILVHAIKCWADPAAPNMRRWVAEIANWHADLMDRLTPAMRVRIDMGVLWRRAVRQAGLDLAEQRHDTARDQVARQLNDVACPLVLDDLAMETVPIETLVARIEARLTPGA
jgi:hypothetical protein